MALTDAQKCSVYEILNISQVDTASLHNGFGVSLTLSDMDTLKDEVTTRITALTSAQETKVVALISAWDAIYLNVGKIEGGSVGGVAGTSYSFEEARMRIREALYIYIPIFHMIDAIKRRKNQSINGASSFVPISLS